MDREKVCRGASDTVKGKQINIQSTPDTDLMLIIHCSDLSACSRGGFEKPDSATRTRSNHDRATVNNFE